MSPGVLGTKYPFCQTLAAPRTANKIAINGPTNQSTAEIVIVMEILSRVQGVQRFFPVYSGSFIDSRCSFKV